MGRPELTQYTGQLERVTEGVAMWPNMTRLALAVSVVGLLGAGYALGLMPIYDAADNTPRQEPAPASTIGGGAETSGWPTAEIEPEDLAGPSVAMEASEAERTASTAAVTEDGDQAAVISPAPSGPSTTSRSVGGASTPTTAPAPTTTAPAPTTTAPAPTTTAPAPTTTAPAPTTTAPTPTSGVPSGAIEVRPGDDVVTIVSKAPNGATIFFHAGTYSGISIKPRQGQTFVGASGAKLDGAGKPYAFRSSASNVTIKGLEITGYRPAKKEAAVHPENGAHGWRIEGNAVHHNAEIGVKAYIDWTVIGNRIHHNGRYGLTGSGSGLKVLDNEISHNSTDYGPSGDSGGTKFVLTHGLVLRGNHVHGNRGNGLWVDINNVNAVIEANTVNGNEWSGIFIEISCGGVIRNNRVDGNGHGDPYANWMSGAGIQVANSPGVTVTGNRLSGNAKGIGGIHWDHPDRGLVTNCRPELKDLKVTGNTISQSGGAAAGIDAKIDTGAVWSSWGNTFASNVYDLSDGTRYRWAGGWISPAEWAALGLG
jgi:parallel beta-helix repeat protein